MVSKQFPSFEKFIHSFPGRAGGRFGEGRVASARPPGLDRRPLRGQLGQGSAGDPGRGVQAAAAAGGVVAAVRQGAGEEQEILKCFLSLRENVELATFLKR